MRNLEYRRGRLKKCCSPVGRIELARLAGLGRLCKEFEGSLDTYSDFDSDVQVFLPS